MWEEYYCYNTTFTNLTGGNGTVFTDNEIRLDTDADFKFMKTSHMPIQTLARVRYRDDTNGRYLMKGNPDLRTISSAMLSSMSPGNPIAPGFMPFIWPRPYIIPASTTFTVSMSDFSGLTSTVYLAFHGTKIRQGQAPWDRKFRALVPFSYSLSSAGFVTISANGTLPVTIPTDNDAHFVVYKVTGTRTDECTLSIKDGGRERQWMNTPVFFDNFVGNGHFPHIFAAPRFIPRGNVIAINLADLSGASNNVELQFIGVKLYE